MLEMITRLTQKGIMNLLSQKREENQLILQVLRCNSDSSNNARIQLSDGFCYANGVLIDDAKIIAADKNIEDFSIIRIKSEDIVLSKSENQITFELKNYEIAKSELTNEIGYPIPYSEYAKNGFVNTNGLNLISEGSKYLTIRQILTQDLIKNCCLRAKVLKKPPRYGKVMNIQLEDKDRSHIQCVLFQEVANVFGQRLQENNWYTFQNVNVQINNKKQQKQLKITMSTVITPYTNKFITQKPLHYGHFPTNQFSFHSAFDIKMQQSKADQTELNIKLFLDQNQQQMGVNPNDCSVTACVRYIKEAPNGKGRFVGVMDRHENNFEILLWKQFDSISLRVGETYYFQHFRAKSYKDKLELASIRDKTQVTISSQKINRKDYEQKKIQMEQKRIEIEKEKQREIEKQKQIEKLKLMDKQQEKMNHFNHGQKENQKIAFKPNESKAFIKKRKILEKSDTLMTVSEILQTCSKQLTSMAPLYFNCYAYLVIPAIENEGKFNIAQQQNKFFTVSCKICKKDPTSSKYVEIGLNEQQYRCKACGAKDTNINIMWNPRVKLIDNGDKEISCRMNDQIAERLFGMRAEEAYTMFSTNLQEFVFRAKKVHFMHQVFKINSKYKDGGQSRFFNVIDMYDQSSATLMEDIKIRFNQKIENLKLKNQNNRSEPMDIEYLNQ